MFRNQPSAYWLGIRRSLEMGYHGDDDSDDPIVHLYFHSIFYGYRKG